MEPNPERIVDAVLDAALCRLSNGGTAGTFGSYARIAPPPSLLGFWINAIRVFIAAEDHLPPPVHSSAGWVARFRFSFLSDVTGLYRFRRRGRKPTEATLNGVAEAIMAQLPACRASWWRTHGSRHGIGLVNRRAETRRVEGGDGLLVKVALEPGKAATGITSAGYDPDQAKITLTLDDGRTLSLTAGRHIEEAEEW